MCWYITYGPYNCVFGCLFSGKCVICFEMRCKKRKRSNPTFHKWTLILIALHIPRRLTKCHRRLRARVNVPCCLLFCLRRFGKFVVRLAVSTYWLRLTYPGCMLADLFRHVLIWDQTYTCKYVVNRIGYFLYAATGWGNVLPQLRDTDLFHSSLLPTSRFRSLAVYYILVTISLYIHSRYIHYIFVYIYILRVALFTCWALSRHADRLPFGSLSGPLWRLWVSRFTHWMPLVPFGHT